jgi:hypothetical protein
MEDDSMKPQLFPALAVVLTLALLLPSSASADGSWIDGPRVNWNQAGMSVPAAPAMTADVEPRCLELRRRPETFEDKQAAAAGWSLWGSYQAGWGMVSVKVLSGFDSACRPLGFQELVFVDGAFAGTISPVLMESRTDGAGAVLAFVAPDSLAAVFRRYQPSSDPCCPSGMAAMTFTIDRSGPTPVLVPQS